MSAVPVPSVSERRPSRYRSFQAAGRSSASRNESPCAAPSATPVRSASTRVRGVASPAVTSTVMGAVGNVSAPTHVSFAAGLARSNDQDVPVQASVRPSSTASVPAPVTARSAASSAWTDPASAAVTVPFVRPSVPLKTCFVAVPDIPPWTSDSFSTRSAV